MSSSPMTVPADDAERLPAARGLEILVLMAAAGRRVTAAISSRLEHPELATNVPVLVLCELSRRGPLRPRDLMDATQLTSGGLTKQLDRLEELGMIERSFGLIPVDRRGSIVSLTPAGVQVARSIAITVEEQMEELRVLVGALHALTEA